MNFRKLEIIGFKSFADKIEILFEPGTTAVVGPNGCGKSNICDAIKWALGEQNAKSLRCDKMESIIFNGGSARRPLGMAQVILTIANSGKILQSDYTDVEVSRRLFRSGESEYYINRNRCLLKDIQEIFMDTGLGVNSYSIMEQGHIDLILNSNLQDRRLILEEAAGITKFRHRKKVSLRKLEVTEQNLVRVNDILYELEHQVDSLKRQASKARRYQDYHAEIKVLDTKLSLHRYGTLMIEFKNTQDKMTDSDDRMRSISSAATKLEAELETRRLEITEAEAKLADLRMHERKVQSGIEESESKIAVLKERIANLKQRQQLATVELTRLQEQLQESDKQIATVSVENGKLGESIYSQESELKLAQENADKLDRHVAATEKEADELKAQTIDMLNKRAKAQNELSAAASRLDYLVARLERLNINAENFRTEQAELEAGMAELHEEVNARENEMNDLAARQKQVDSAITQSQSKAAVLEKNIKEIEQKRGNRSARLQSLKELQTAYEGYDAGVRAILGKAKSQSLGGICSVIAEIVRTEPRYELAIEASLGTSLQDIVAENVDSAKAAVEYLKERRSGRATLLPVDIIASRDASPVSLPDGVIAVASQTVSCDPRYFPIVEYLLGDTLIVADLDTALNLAKAARIQSPQTPLRFTTLDGQVVLSTGAITGGAGSEGTALLRRSREIVDLEKEIAQLDEQLSHLAKDRNSVTSEISDLQHEKERISGELQNKQISHTGLQKDISLSKQRLSRLEKEIAIAETERDALEKEIVTLEENKARFSENAAQLEDQSEEIDKRIAALQVEMKSKIQQRDAVVQQCTNIKVQLASKKQQEKGLAEKLRSLEQAKDRLLQAMSSHQTSATSDIEAEKEIAEEISTQEALLEELFQERSQVESEISGLEDQKQKAQIDLTQGDALIRDHRRELGQLNQVKYQLEVTKTQLQMNIDSLAVKMRERYGVSLTDEQNQNQESVDEDELARKIEELRTRMENMGSVNLTAIDEYNRQKERYDLLVAQKEDLVKAKDSLYNIIQKINKESRDRLKETFDSVNASFQELFQRLFGGGHAELVMIGEGDVLESGVEIIARPPGKKPQDISMLSSGERSLVAIAILFALFRIKPSPFCLLDEVDAALDDANVGRFTDMVKEFSKETQFVIITHNKRTMEIADILYGITMEESGVSKMVSLDMRRET